MSTAPLQRLWQARPRLFNNPIILRELLAQLRKKQSFLFLLFFIIVAVQSLVSHWQYLVQTQNSIASFAVFTSISYNIALILAIITPLISATAVNSEYQSDTWDLLLTTHVNLSSILFGKIFSSMVFIYFLFLSIIPIFSLLMTLGGVSPQEIFLFILMGTHIIVVSTMVGLYCSIRFKSPMQSIFISYIICFCLFFVLPYFGGFLLSPFTITTIALGGNQFVGFQQYRPYSLHLYLIIQLILVSLESTILLILCVSHINIPLKERCLQFMDRIIVFVFGYLKHLIVGIIVSAIVIMLWLTILSCYTPNLSEQNPSINILLLNGFWGQYKDIWIQNKSLIVFFLKCLVLIPAWLMINVYLVDYWKSNPWDAVDTTPRNLRRLLFQCVYTSLSKGSRFIVSFFPCILLIPTFADFNFIQLFWLLFGFLDAMILLSVASLFISINKQYICQSMFWSLWAFLILLVFIPRSLIVMFREIFYTPQFVFLDIFLRTYMLNPVYGLDFYISLLSFYYIYLIIIFVFFILAAQRRVLQQAGLFKYETLLQWFKRTLMNMMPQRGKTPSKPLPPIPNNINPLLFKELRENLIGPRARRELMKWTAGLFCLSIFMLIVNDFMSYRINSNPGNPYPLLICMFPLMIVPFAANAFRREQDQFTWEILLTTTLPASSLLNAKFITSLALCALYSIALIFPLLVRDGNFKNLPMFGNLFLFLGVLVLLIVSISLYFSLCLRKTVTSYVISLAAAYLFVINPIGIPSPTSLMGKYRLLREQFFSLTELRDYNAATILTIWQTERNTILLAYFLMALLFYYLTYKRLQTYMYRGK